MYLLLIGGKLKQSGIQFNTHSDVTAYWHRGWGGGGLWPRHRRMFWCRPDNIHRVARLSPDDVDDDASRDADESGPRDGPGDTPANEADPPPSSLLPSSLLPSQQCPSSSLIGYCPPWWQQQANWLLCVSDSQALDKYKFVLGSL